jgi:uncharacterized protein YdhG (YjbR/CyaY superfamily)
MPADFGSKIACSDTIINMTTQPTGVSVGKFLESVSDKRRQESHILITMMQEISGEKPHMWGPSIIGFGSMHYKYDTGREGDMPRLAFSPRKASITVYFEGFDSYGELLADLGKHKVSVACLYINKLADIKLGVLREMLERSFARSSAPPAKAATVDEYVASVPSAARPKFDELRRLVKETLPDAKEVLSYGIVGYKIDDKRARVFISGWKDHLAVYPVPKSKELQTKLKPYIKGKGTLWFSLDEPLPKPLIVQVVQDLAS